MGFNSAFRGLNGQEDKSHGGPNVFTKYTNFLFLSLYSESDVYCVRAEKYGLYFSKRQQVIRGKQPLRVPDLNHYDYYL
jgi:hypothetical protein